MARKPVALNVPWQDKLLTPQESQALASNVLLEAMNLHGEALVTRASVHIDKALTENGKIMVCALKLLNKQKRDSRSAFIAHEIYKSFVTQAMALAAMRLCASKIKVRRRRRAV